ncbi:hypothetical protein L1987_17115 [Smallanthus sonchifolius]|uniref:Uncharacterized protein n=1 Tax=Smallanthus sonchifolius TaxID=185202 RepID=A0ACB9IWD1_9ASTR|nr:hypothetical protein L1987_17115 [Smallanthus sonchifolius]
MENYWESWYVSYVNYGYLQKYKGVVPQPNGNWGAQLYTNNQRIWLGTFTSEIDAAIAYDRASMKFRGVDAPRNLPLTKSTLLEASFQSYYSIETILGMIKYGSYQAKFEGYQRVLKADKESDIKVVAQGLANDEVVLSIYDPQGRLWEFRYCYWKSSKSFVFTRGWNLFVKDKKLMPKDKIIFYFQENLEMQNMGFWVIDTCKSSSHIGLSLKLSVKQEEEESLKDDKMDVEMIQTSNVKIQGLKLFGVQIIG